MTLAFMCCIQMIDLCVSYFTQKEYKALSLELTECIQKNETVHCKESPVKLEWILAGLLSRVFKCQIIQNLSSILSEIPKNVISKEPVFMPYILDETLPNCLNNQTNLHAKSVLIPDEIWVNLENMNDSFSNNSNFYFNDDKKIQKKNYYFKRFVPKLNSFFITNSFSFLSSLCGTVALYFSVCLLDNIINILLRFSTAIVNFNTKCTKYLLISALSITAIVILVFVLLKEAKKVESTLMTEVNHIFRNHLVTSYFKITVCPDLPKELRDTQKVELTSEVKLIYLKCHQSENKTTDVLLSNYYLEGVPCHQCSFLNHSYENINRKVNSKYVIEWSVQNKSAPSSLYIFVNRNVDEPIWMGNIDHVINEKTSKLFIKSLAEYKPENDQKLNKSFGFCFTSCKLEKSNETDEKTLNQYCNNYCSNYNFQIFRSSLGNLYSIKDSKSSIVIKYNRNKNSHLEKFSLYSQINSELIFEEKYTYNSLKFQNDIGTVVTYIFGMSVITILSFILEKPVVLMKILCTKVKE